MVARFSVVTVIAAVGNDALVDAALAGLRSAGVRLELATKHGPTGVALIVIDAGGENTIVVAPGSNTGLRPEDVHLPDDAPVLCQLEIPVETAEWVRDNAPADFFLNAAPAHGCAPTADVTIVNRYEFELLTTKDGLIAATNGPEDAVLLDVGAEGFGIDAGGDHVGGIAVAAFVQGDRVESRGRPGRG